MLETDVLNRLESFNNTSCSFGVTKVTTRSDRTNSTGFGGLPKRFPWAGGPVSECGFLVILLCI